MAGNKDYNEGFEDALKHYQKSHVPVKDISESIDKLLDKINKKTIIEDYIIDHLENDLNIEKKKMESLKERRANLNKILDLIKESRESKIECQTKPKK